MTTLEVTCTDYRPYYEVSIINLIQVNTSLGILLVIHTSRRKSRRNDIFY